MSDHSESEDDQSQSQLTSVLQRYASTKGKGAVAAKAADKRTETSKLNMAKARAAKLAGLQKKKESRAFEIDESEDSESEDSSDDEDLVITKKKSQKGGKGGAPAASSDRLSKIEEAIMLLAQQKAKKKPQKRKTVINVSAPQSATAPANQKAQALKNNILNF